MFLQTFSSFKFLHLISIADLKEVLQEKVYIYSIYILISIIHISLYQISFLRHFWGFIGYSFSSTLGHLT